MYKKIFSKIFLTLFVFVSFFEFTFALNTNDIINQNPGSTCRISGDGKAFICQKRNSDGDVVGSKAYRCTLADSGLASNKRIDDPSCQNNLEDEKTAGTIRNDPVKQKELIDKLKKDCEEKKWKFSDESKECANPDWYNPIWEAVKWLVSKLVIALFGIINDFLKILVKLSSWLVDLAVYTTVVKFKTNFSDLSLNVDLGTVGAGWLSVQTPTVGVGGLVPNGNSLIYFFFGMLRDFLNVIIFFMVIIAAIRTIFDGFSEHRQKFLFLLLFSIVVNFSLFFVRIAIDISNIFTLQVYTLMVQPQSIDSFDMFRTSTVSSGANRQPGTLGEYIMNTVDFGEIKKRINSPENNLANNTSLNANNFDDQFGTIQKAAESSVLMNIALMLIYGGFIWLFLFIAGVLFARAFAFLMAMFLAAFLVADLFFSYFGSEAGGDEIVNGVSRFTEKFKMAFWEGLVKGPLLMFFLFLMAVATNAVFEAFAIAGISATTLENACKSAEALQSVCKYDPTFGSSIYWILKFGIFFMLVKAIWDKIEDIASSFGASGSWVSEFGKTFRKNILGYGLRGSARLAGGTSKYLGMGLQNTVGRWASDPTTRFGKFLNKINDGEIRGTGWIKNWRGADRNTVGGWIKGNLSGAATRSIRGIKTGTYDAGNLAGVLDKKVGGRLGKLVNSAAGKAGVEELSFGERVNTSFEDRDAAALKRREERRDKDIERAGTGEVLTYKDLEEASKQVKLKEIDGKNLNYFDTLVNNKDFVEKIKKSTSGTGLPEFNMNAAEADFFRKYVAGDNATLIKVEDYKKKQKELAQQFVDKRAHDRQHDVTHEYEEGKRRATTSVDNRVGGFFAGRGSDGTADELKISTTRMNQKHGKESAGKFNLLVETKKDLESTKAQIETAIKLDNEIQLKDPSKGLTPDQRSKLDSLLTEISDPSSVLNNEIIAKTNNKINGDEKADLVDRFSEDTILHEQIAKFKESAAAAISSVYDNSTTNPDYRTVKDNFDFVSEQVQRSAISLKALEKVSAPDRATDPTGYAIYENNLVAAQKESEKWKKIADNKAKELETATKLAEKAKEYKDKVKKTFAHADTHKDKPADKPAADKH